MEFNIPSAGEPPLAEIRGIQFGLLNSSDIYKLSVYKPDQPVTKTKELADPKLGLPIKTGACGTCNGDHVDQCEGHFAHCLLPTPIFHPNHVGKLVAVLRKICLNCGQPKKKKVGKLERKKQLEQDASTPREEENDSTQRKRPKPGRTSRRLVVDEDSGEEEDDSQCSFSLKHKRKYAEAFTEVEASTENEAKVIVLSSDDDDHSISTKGESEVDEVDEVGEVGEVDEVDEVAEVDDVAEVVEVDEMDEVDEEVQVKASSSTGHQRRSLRSRKSPTDSNENNSTTGPVIDLTNVDMWNPLSVANGGKRKRTEKGEPSQPSIVVVEDIFLATPLYEDLQPAGGLCKYCSGNSERYPEVLLKVEVKERNKDENLSKAIRMDYKVKQKDIDSVAPDYWSFVEPSSTRDQILVKRSRLLLPSEALKIVSKIPDTALARLGMHPKVARPEALIVECVPVPPNCTRIQDDAFGESNIGFKQGIDRATLVFSKLLNKINSIKNTRYGRPMFNAASIEAMELQSLFGLYLREKGAAKAVPGKEKKRVDHVGRVQKRDSRWSLEWLKRHVLGKRGGYSARNVLTGDPFLRVEEIGVPQLVAKHVTIPERVNRLNKTKLQAYVDAGQSLTGRYRACGAVRLVRGNERLEVTRKTSHDLQIGDIVHRHLKDEDLVYVNRPPSLHKHSLLALRVHIQDMTVFTINPAVCAPLHADFDGDCLHVFVPQSEEAKAELHELMTIPEQILPSPDGKTIIGMSQDNILAAYLMTSSPVFLNKEVMFQMAMWSTRRLPIPAIVKSAGGPLWAGKQVIDMTIPEDFSFKSEDGALDIQDGELLSYGGSKNWLTSTNGLMRALAQHSPQAAVNHLDCAQSALREWLLSRGFSVSLRDFYSAADHKLRRKMIEKLRKSVEDAEEMADKLRFCQQSDSTSASSPTVAEALEDVAVSYFQMQFKEIGEELGSEISEDNQLLAMVHSGSKGSLPKAIQQIGCLGLQLYKGEHLLSLSGNKKLSSLGESMQCEDNWEMRGLVKNSLLDGLDPLEFYLHSISVRAGLLRQSLEVTEPGELFKNLMLFLRDLHVSYDGTVRNKCGLEIIQFSYDGVHRPNTMEGSSVSKEFVMPGEAVGILAATAIAQPAYQVMLEANQHVGSKKIRPLALLQDTIFPRSGTKLKVSDRRSILRLKPCLCATNHCEERRALCLKNELQPVSLEMFALAMSIQYVPENSSEWNACRADGGKLRLPWVGHIQLDMNSVIQSNLSIEQVVGVLKTTFHRKGYAKAFASSFLANPVFFCRNACDCMRAGGNSRGFGPCLLFSASLKSRTSKRMAHRSNKKALEIVNGLRDVMVPLILKTIVKGDERVESAKIIWEDAAWSPPGISIDGFIPANPDGELVVEVIVHEKLSMSRGSPWSILKEACAVIDAIDWRRSSPYSVQEVRHSLGVEAARDCILQRLTLATQAAGSTVSRTHLKLVSDLMVHSGEVNGITPFGYRDLLRSLKTSAPFTAGAFRAPIKTFMEAGEKGDEEFLSGVLASSIFGKRVPVGTGADFSLQLQPEVVMDPLQIPMQSMDIFDCLSNLNSKIKDEFPEPPEDACGETGGGAYRMDVEEGAWAFNADGNRTNGKENGWGSNAGDADAGGWAPDNFDVSTEGVVSVEPTEGAWGCSTSKNVDGGEGGWGCSPSSNADRGEGGWGSSPSKTADEGEGGWGCSPSKNADGGEGGWGCSPTKNADGGEGEWGSSPSKAADGGEGGWGSSPSKNAGGGEGGWGCSPSKHTDGGEGGWGSSPVKTADGGDGGWGCSPSKNEDGGEGGWGSSPTKNADGGKGGWGCSPTKNGDGGEGGWGCSPSNNADGGEGGWGFSPSKDVGGGRGVINTADDRWGTKSPSKIADSGSWGPEAPFTNKWGDEPRQFRPTGANNICLGKRRQFGIKVVGVGSEDVQMSSTSSAPVPISDIGRDRMSKADELQELTYGRREDRRESDSSSHLLEEGTPLSNWIVESVHEGGSEAGWDDSEDQGLKDTRSGWSSHSSPAGHRKEHNAGWSSRVWQNGGARYNGRTSGETGAIHRGGSTPRKEHTTRALDSRKDSEDWIGIVGLVRTVREILHAYELEERLKDEHHQMLMTQVLPHHPSAAAKIGCGVAFFKVASFERVNLSGRPTHCFFLVRTDGSEEDFSYHKCLRTLASRMNPPLDDLYKIAFMDYDKSARFQR